MCVALPGRVVFRGEQVGISLPGRVVFGTGEEVSVDLGLVSEVALGDFVVVHAGYAISVVAAADAVEAASLMEQVGGLTLTEG